MPSPDPANPTGSPAAIPAAAATPEQGTVTPTASPSADSSYGFTAEDFSNPVTGPKLKAWQKGWGEVTHRAKTAEARAQQYEQHAKAVERLEALMDRYPTLRKSVLDAHEGRYTEAVATGTPAPEETEEQRQRRELREEIKSEVSTDMGFNMFLMGLGKGDLEAGQKLYGQHRPRLDAILAAMTKGTPHQKLMLAWKLAQTQAPSADSPPPPPPPPAAPGATGSEPGAGTPGTSAPLDWTKLTEDQQFAETMRSAGFANLGAYMEAAGQFGR